MPLITAFSFFLLLSFSFLTLILPSWSTHIPGGLQDTRLFLWNLWWFPEAVRHLQINPFHTPMLFHPFGVSLLSHDYPLWYSLWGYAVTSLDGTVPLAVNLTFLLTWALNGFCTFGLAREVLNKKEYSPALVAGLYVMTHSYLQARLMQNWGQFILFSIPLFFWMLLRARRTGRAADHLWAGLALALNAACHYYFLVYSAGLWGLWLITKFWPWSHAIHRRASPRRLWRWGSLALSALGLGIALWIYAAAPMSLNWRGMRIGLNTPVNALLVFWVGLIAWGLSWLELSWEPRRTFWTASDWKNQLWVLLGATVALSPLLIGTWELIRSGDYPRQHILWKTHPLGVNLFAVITPNACHALWGKAVSRCLEWAGIHPQEQAAGIGWVCLAVIAWSRLWQSGVMARRWVFLASLCSVLALGSYLHVGRFNTWLPLPYYFWRLLPVMGNVRMPERWMAVGSVAWGVVLALALYALAARRGWKIGRVCAIAGFLILLENWPGVPGVRLGPEEPLYQQLRQEPPGAVLALPFIAGDSSIAIGDAAPSRFVFPWDHLRAQSFHHHPMVGGYVGRVPRRIIQSYQRDPFLGNLVALEEGNPLPWPDSPGAGCQSADAFRWDYVLVYTQATPQPAWTYVQKEIPLQEIGHQSDMLLYRVRKQDCARAHPNTISAR